MRLSVEFHGIGSDLMRTGEKLGDEDFESGAILAFDRSIEKDPRNALALVDRGRWKEMRGDRKGRQGDSPKLYAEAQQDYSRAWEAATDPRLRAEVQFRLQQIREKLKK